MGADGAWQIRESTSDTASSVFKGLNKAVGLILARRSKG